jgi:serine protease Do
MLQSEEQEQNSRLERKPQKKANKLRSLASSFTAGILGSVLTMAVVTNFNDIQGIIGSSQQNNTSAVNSSSVNNTTDPAKIVQTSTKASASIADTVEEASKSIVGITNLQASNREGTGNEESGTGSGVLFSKGNNAAYIVTNNHVIEGAQEIEISLFDGKKTNAELIGADALTDLAVLKIEPKHVQAVLEFGDSSILRPGDPVLAIGNPLGLDLSRTVTQGIVSAVDRTISLPTSAGDWEVSVVQTDAAINPGNSGGALINTDGKVIGINSMKISTNGVEGLGFAIPSNDLVPIVNEIIKNGKIERPYMGISMASLEEVPQMYKAGLPEKITEGVMVTFLDTKSAAAKAGINVQDIIVSIDGQDIKNPQELRKLLYSKYKIGDKINLKVYQKGELNTLTLTLTSNNNEG